MKRIPQSPDCSVRSVWSCMNEIITQEKSNLTRVKFFILRTTLTEEDMAYYGVLFQSFWKPKNAKEERKVNRKSYPEVSKCSEKVVVEKIFLEWSNGR